MSLNNKVLFGIKDKHSVFISFIIYHHIISIFNSLWIFEYIEDFPGKVLKIVSFIILKIKSSVNHGCFQLSTFNINHSTVAPFNARSTFISALSTLSVDYWKSYWCVKSVSVAKTTQSVWAQRKRSLQSQILPSVKQNLLISIIDLNQKSNQDQL